MKKLDLRTAEIDSKEVLRKRAIDMIDKGYSQKEVADILGASQNTISTWKRNYKKFGMKGLKEKTRGRKKGEKRILKTRNKYTKYDCRQNAGSTKITICTVDKKSH